MAWFRRFSTTYHRLFDQLFHGVRMHALTHALLFAVLAYLLAWPLVRRASMAPWWRFALAVLGLVVAVALLQEGVQLVYKDRPLGADELLDVGIDVVGASLGLLVFWVRVSWASRLTR
jgi:VanZ family protein